jgi:hypothetical protein
MKFIPLLLKEVKWEAISAGLSVTLLFVVGPL